MTSLSDQIDRLSRSTRSIKDTTTHALGALQNNPFTDAVLSTQLGDLIRDIDASELGLFNIVPSSGAEIKRVEFTGSTPLRKPTRRDDKPAEIDPEVYAQAALKCIDQYQPVRPMPRARSQASAILDRLSLVRANIVTLNVILQQIRVADNPSVKAQIAKQDHEVKQLQARMNELSKRRHAAIPRQHDASGQTTNPTVAEPETDIVPLSPHEDRFWNTPAEASRILCFSDDLLMDEQVNLDDTSSTSFINALPEASTGHGTLPDPLELPMTPVTQTSGVESLTSNYMELAVPSTMPLSPALSPLLAKRSINPSDRSQKLGRVRVNTEVERIVSKIWMTVGDIIMPGCSFSSESLHSMPLSVKDTIVHLQELCNLPPQPNSPGTSSVSTSSTGQAQPPGLQQILTAYLLVSLLSAPPQYSMPLNKMKDNLAAKAKSGGVSVGMLGQGTSRVLYGCVAKRLIRIDRGGGEQTVKFDI